MALPAKKAVRLRTFYDVLGVSPIASCHEIRAAYLNLAKQHHPDVVSPRVDDVPVSSIDDAASKFREIQEAYSTLSNDWKRTVYDRDVQFQTAFDQNCHIESVDGALAWRENFNMESREARIARRERYKRYAAGERNDLPPVSLSTRGSLIGLLLGGTALTYVCAKAPNWFGGQGEQTFHDPVTDDHSVGLVQAFYNPIARTWERIRNDQIAPTIPDLIREYKKVSPQLVERWEYEERSGGNNVADLNNVTVMKVPKTRTIAATVYRDESGHVGINKRTLSESVSRFINRIE
jgi:curved DNA-binding protein CbpA